MKISYNMTMNNQKNKKIAISYIVLSSLFFAIMAFSVKSIPEIPLAQKVFFRNFMGLIAIGVPIIIHKKSFKPNKPLLIFFRVSFGLAGVAFYYSSLVHLNLADAVILNKLSPFFVVILSAIFLSEKFTRNKIIALLIAVIGAIFVVRPSFNFSILPSLLGLSGAFCAGCAYTLIRKISKYDPPYLIVFYFCLFSSITTMPFMLAGQFIMPNTRQLFMLLLVGLAALGGQMCMTTAYKYAPASETSIYSYVNIVFSMLMSIVFWHQMPNYLSIIGTLFIISAAIINFYSNRKSTP